MDDKMGNWSKIRLLCLKPSHSIKEREETTQMKNKQITNPETRRTPTLQTEVLFDHQAEIANWQKWKVRINRINPLHAWMGDGHLSPPVAGISNTAVRFARLERRQKEFKKRRESLHDQKELSLSPLPVNLLLLETIAGPLLLSFLSSSRRERR